MTTRASEGGRQRVCADVLPQGEVESLFTVPAGFRHKFNKLVHCSDHAWLLLAPNAFISKCHRQVSVAFFLFFQQVNKNVEIPATKPQQEREQKKKTTFDVCCRHKLAPQF